MNNKNNTNTQNENIQLCTLSISAAHTGIIMPHRTV